MSGEYYRIFIESIFMNEIMNDMELKRRSYSVSYIKFKDSGIIVKRISLGGISIFTIITKDIIIPFEKFSEIAKGLNCDVLCYKNLRWEYYTDRAPVLSEECVLDYIDRMYSIH